MSAPRVRVVGLGPGNAHHLTARTSELLAASPVVRLRTRMHPAAQDIDAPSYDQWYESAESFEQLYARIVEDLVRLAEESPGAEVVYAVPGSPVVAERTVEMLRERGGVEVVCEPAVSVIDVACSVLALDPMARGLRVVDALASNEPLRGPGPLLILQAYSPEVLATVADRLAPDTPVVVLHHLGLAEERVVALRARELTTFVAADHLTSLYVERLRTAGEAMDDLVGLTRRLRAQCPWDREQTHASLSRYLLEESYEALDAIEALARMVEAHEDDGAVVEHAREELGDLLFQVLFHAELADEEDRFDLVSIADAEREKLTGRHPHVFGDVVVRDADEVASNWESIKAREKGRASVLDGIAWAAPSLAVHEKVLHRARDLTLPAVAPDAPEALERLRASVAALSLASEGEREPGDVDGRHLQDAAEMLSVLAARMHVPLEVLLRERVMSLRDQVWAVENPPDRSKGAE